jgi:hypothetical protein
MNLSQESILREANQSQYRLLEIEGKKLKLDEKRDKRERWLLVLTVISVSVSVGSLIVAAMSLYVASTAMRVASLQ